MSFRDDEIYEAIAEATGGRLEFFGKDGYGFRKLSQEVMQFEEQRT